MREDPGAPQDPDHETQISEPTAMPKRSMPGALAVGERLEIELSIDVDDLGRHFLTEAVEQGDVTRIQGELELAVNEPAPSDGVTDAVYEGAQTLWEATLSFARPEQDEESTALPAFERGHRPKRREGLDLTEDALHEASLLDYENERSGRVDSPRLKTDDRNTHQKHPGHRGTPFARAERRRSARRLVRPTMLIAIAVGTLALALPWLARFVGARRRRFERHPSR